MSAVEISEKLEEEVRIYQLGFRLARRALVRDKIGFQDAVLTGEKLAAELNSFKDDIYKLVKDAKSFVNPNF